MVRRRRGHGAQFQAASCLHLVFYADGIVVGCMSPYAQQDELLVYTLQDSMAARLVVQQGKLRRPIVTVRVGGSTMVMGIVAG